MQCGFVQSFGCTECGGWGEEEFKIMGNFITIMVYPILILQMGRMLRWFGHLENTCKED